MQSTELDGPLRAASAKAKSVNSLPIQDVETCQAQIGDTPEQQEIAVHVMSNVSSQVQDGAEIKEWYRENITAALPHCRFQRAMAKEQRKVQDPIDHHALNRAYCGSQPLGARKIAQRVARKPMSSDEL
jgi:hypothetical protein